mgnify:CR=1 FL=1
MYYVYVLHAFSYVLYGDEHVRFHQINLLIYQVFWKTHIQTTLKLADQRH